MNNKFVKVGLAGLLAASMTACSNTPAEPSQEKTPDTANSGVYDVKGTGYGGEMNLKVTIADQKITDIELVDSHETNVVIDRAFPVIKERILEANSPVVDSVTAATFSSFGVKAAVADAMKQAGKMCIRDSITNTLRLLKLPKSVQQLVTENKLSMGHVRPLVTIEDEGEAYDLAMKIAEEGLSVREVERLVKERQEKPKPKAAKKAEDPNLLYVEEVMQNKLQTRVKVDKKQIVIQYSGTQDLNRILELIHCLEETES